LRHVDVVRVVAVLDDLEPVAVERQELLERLVGKTSYAELVALRMRFFKKQFDGFPDVSVALRIGVDVPLRHADQQSVVTESDQGSVCFAPYKEICETVIRTMAAACANLLFYKRFIF
jgi:hypothetical protein